jgi:hypothetical protein
LARQLRPILLFFLPLNFPLFRMARKVTSIPVANLKHKSFFSRGITANKRNINFCRTKVPWTWADVSTRRRRFPPFRAEGHSAQLEDFRTIRFPVDDAKICSTTMHQNIRSHCAQLAAGRAASMVARFRTSSLELSTSPHAAVLGKIKLVNGFSGALAFVVCDALR